MPSTTADLGSFELESEEFGLQLRLSSLADFATSAEDGIDHLRETLTYDLSNNYSNTPVWIVRGNQFRMQLKLRLEDALTVEQQSALIETLVSGLRSANVLWKQLSLEATYVENTDCVEGEHVVTIALSHARDVLERRRPSLHKLSADVPDHDVRSPNGVQSASMDVVRLSIRITKAHQRARRKLDRRNGQPTDSLCQDQTPEAHWLLSAQHGLVEPAVPRRITAEDTLDFCDDEWSYSSDDDSNFMLLDSEIMPKSAMVSTNLDREGVVSLNNMEGDHATVDAAFEMIDRAVVMAISGYRRGSKAIVVTASESFHSLAQLAPSLWSPDYLANVARRAVFLPTIEHALHTVVRPTKCSPSSKADTANSAARLPGAAAGMYSVHLWRKLVEGVYDVRSARRLRPLSTAIEAQEFSMALADEVLDCSQDDPQMQVGGKNSCGSLMLTEELLEDDSDFGDEEVMLCGDEDFLSLDFASSGDDEEADDMIDWSGLHMDHESSVLDAVTMLGDEDVFVD